MRKIKKSVTRVVARVLVYNIDTQANEMIEVFVTDTGRRTLDQKVLDLIPGNYIMIKIEKASSDTVTYSMPLSKFVQLAEIENGKDDDEEGNE